jgi:pimeloyl-ACP methyl ester carboxylesterase/cation transport regulator ChaC
MPVPIRDDGTPGPSRRMVLFVHGFNSNAADCWNKMLELLQHDVSLSQTFDFRAFEYTTSITRVSLLKRLPDIDEIGAELGSYLDRELVECESGYDNYIDATLVGHSMGGLVIQSYLVQRLNSGRAGELDRIRQVIFFATPNFGSDLLGLMRRLLSPLLPNPQEELLRSFSREVMHLHKAVRERIVDAHNRDDHAYPLPAYCFWGDSDKIVPEMSARGHFPHGEPLKGDHFTLNKPDGREGDNYKAFVQTLLHPHGHKHIWEVDSFRYSARVSPLRSGTIVVAKHGGKQRLVDTDNSALVERQVRFSRNNHCDDPFQLRYGTRNGGWIDPNVPDFSVTSADKIRLYDDCGTEIITEIAPAPGRKSSLRMQVYKGFDAGHRDYHMHLGRKSYFRKLDFEVDLTEYLSTGWRVIHGPHLYFHPIDSGDHRLCANRKMLDPDSPHDYDPSGIWRWTLEHVKEGVIDIAWDVAPQGPALVRESPSVVELCSDEHAVFGYGSLLSVASLERTLGRRYSGPFVLSDLVGWYRSWNVTMPNSTFVFQDSAGAWAIPERIVYLNISPATGRRVNGVIFVINEDDLRTLDKREWIYDRVKINEMLRGVTVLKGPAWAYVGKPEHLLATQAVEPRQAAIRRSYLDMLDSGKSDLGSSFATAYDDSTDPVPTRLIVLDHRREELISGAP